MKSSDKSLEIILGNLRIDIIIGGGFFHPNSPWSATTHSHSSYELHCLFDGEAEFDIGGKAYTLEKGRLYIIKPYEYHETKKIVPPIKKLCFMFTLERIKSDCKGDIYNGFLKAFTQLKSPISILNPDFLYFDRLPSCIDIYAVDAERSLCKMRALLTLVFLDIFEKLCLQSKAASQNRSSHCRESTLQGKSALQEESKLQCESNSAATAIMSNDNKRRLDIEDYIYNNFKGEITVDMLAHHLHLSRRQTGRFIKERMSSSFTELVRKQRIEYAKKLLTENPEMSLADVAYEVGYKSSKGFSAAFLLCTARSPVDFSAERLTFSTEKGCQISERK